MARRVSVPDDLFRTDAEKRAQADRARAPVRAVPDPAPETAPEADVLRRPSGRVKHDEKMTVYVTSAELLEIEHARLALRAGQGLAVDRGRLVREAISLALADYEEHGDESALVRRLTEG